MSHPFGNLIKRYLSRKHGLSQTKLAKGIYVDPAIITRMCQGKGLTRDRIVKIILWFHEQAVFESADEANALLQAAGLVELNPAQSKEMEILCKLREATQQLDRVEEYSLDHQRSNVRGRWRGRWGKVATAVSLMLDPFLFWMMTRPKPPAWQEDFNPLDSSKWLQVSARWEDLPGSTARLIEDNPNPNEAFGKVESQIITVNVDTYPFLRIKVTAVDLNASYTIQILDKRTSFTKDILKGISFPIPSIQRVNLAQEMGWEGKGAQSFTINIWVSGRGKSVTFDFISISAD